MKSRWGLLASLSLNAVLLAAIFLRPAVASPGYRVVVPPHQETVRSHEDIASLAVARLDAMADQVVRDGLGQVTPQRIVSITATTPDGVAVVEPRLAGTIDAGGPIWVVRAEGTFVGGRGKGAPTLAQSGFLVFDDATGEPLAMGLP